MPPIDEDQQARDALRFYSYEVTPERFASRGSLGGLSGARFWSFANQDRSLLLRRWPMSYAPTQLRELHALLRHATRRGVDYLPNPLPTAEGDSLLLHSRHCWELQPWMPGSPQPGSPAAADLQVAEHPDDHAPGIDQVAIGAAAIASLHQAAHDFPGRPSSVGTPPSVLKRARALRELITAAPDAGTQRLDPRLLRASEATELQQRLSSLLPEAAERIAAAATCPTSLQMIHGDTRREHLLFSGARVTGLIDFGAVTLDSPMVDLARWLSETAAGNHAAWRRGLEAYDAIRPLSDVERRLVPTLAITGIVISGFNWLRWARADSPGTPDPQAANARIKQVSHWVGLVAQRRHPAQQGAAC